ncbi:MAG TPA: bifunctional proline dehydrogenase/L-glutamate gamma-semialdehyde dehydrogenase PutA [Stellaceae bacterium]|jgi:RHH-type proline utilization regulon transcriptional repressor/proline dehydrogenase/delta 1-pyrroline-5-carboxylate dehydrogenase|nr:bifunctional proline dehydrogenase/L-glutamate gamma-semialdehyde dehydrogenase PutA [Stellaceae bacterium]
MDVVFAVPTPSETQLRAAIGAAHRRREPEAVAAVLAAAEIPAAAGERIAQTAGRLVAAVRGKSDKGGIDAFLHEYTLSSREGVALMCLAEALLRIPDAGTIDRLIRDRLASADWESHLGHSGSVFVNASTWALMLTGRLLDDDDGHDLASALHRFAARSAEPVVRQAILAAMRILGHQFVMGRTIEEALARAGSSERQGYRHSYDMLGEAARTATDAARYRAAYLHAIDKIGAAAKGRPVTEAPGISVKLSALHPRYEPAQHDRVRQELLPRLIALCRAAKTANVGLTIDAEEADRLELSLDLFEAVARDPSLSGWDGLGLAVQAYQKRALAVIDWLADLAGRSGRRLMVRLVKGAYWDSEIKRAQERGLDTYPVYTRKVATDVSYLACAKRLLAAGAASIYPQFATHNAHTLAAILELAGDRRDWEFQRLHGMGEVLYDEIVEPMTLPCRVYAPVGSHEDLLAYLVRRLLENGANTSFVNRIVDERQPIEAIIADPIARLAELDEKPHPRIPLPRDLLRPSRLKASGLDLADRHILAGLRDGLAAAFQRPAAAGPIVAGLESSDAPAPVFDPADRRCQIGVVSVAGADLIEKALSVGARAARDWDRTAADTRAAMLEQAAEVYERDRHELMALIIREGGRTIPAALSEVREAVDYLRYYAARARADFAVPEPLPGPTGERNEIALHGRGVFVCISPWNFPLAIFTGQVAAALAAGNAVIAKPAEQTPLVAAAAIRRLLAAGIPADIVHLLPGTGEAVGAALVGDRRIAGVAFTGSTETARNINQALAARSGPIIPLIAETGGQNAMIVDSSALPEQVVADVVTSAFDSAGQRCSALRLLYLQDDIAEKVLPMLAGAMAELTIGDPALLATDVGPVVDADSRTALYHHAERMAREARLLFQCTLPAVLEYGSFVAPQAYEIDSARRLEREVFGPILHIVRWRAERLDAVLDEIEATGYALTLGVHSRVDATIRHILGRLGIGNSYVNRNMIGAVVGVQPFGGEQLSGTGPKAGGPRYLHRFATERTISVDITASGGNAALLSMDDQLPITER